MITFIYFRVYPTTVSVAQPKANCRLVVLQAEAPNFHGGSGACCLMYWGALLVGLMCAPSPLALPLCGCPSIYDWNERCVRGVSHC